MHERSGRGDRVACARGAHEAGLTQEELAQRLGMSQVGLSGVERGRSLVTLETLVEVARVTDKSLGYFLPMGVVPVDGLSGEAREVADIMETLPQRERDSILDFAHHLAQKVTQQADQHGVGVALGSMPAPDVHAQRLGLEVMGADRVSLLLHGWPSG